MAVTGMTERHEVPDTQLSESIDALQRAARSLRDETGRVTAALDGVASALDHERQMNGEAVPSHEVPPKVENHEPSDPGIAEAPDRAEAVGGAESWVPGLLCASALLISVALLEVGLALAIPVAIVAAVLLPMKWWMPALAAVALGLALAIESPGGEMADRVAAMLVVFVLIAGALLLYEIWERLHLRLQT
jgi:hypothetical protein